MLYSYFYRFNVMSDLEYIEESLRENIQDPKIELVSIISKGYVDPEVEENGIVNQYEIHLKDHELNQSITYYLKENDQFVLTFQFVGNRTNISFNTINHSLWGMQNVYHTQSKRKLQIPNI